MLLKFSDRRPRRTHSKDLLRRSVKPHHLSPVVKRASLFDSRDHPSFTDGLLARGNGVPLTINNTVKNATGTLFLLVPEVTWYVEAFNEFNRYPNGAFFDNTTAMKERGKYDVEVEIDSVTSTDSTINFSSTFINNTGSTVNVGVIVTCRFIANTDRNPSTS